MIETDKALAALIEKITTLTDPMTENGGRAAMELAGAAYQLNAIYQMFWPLVVLLVTIAAGKVLRDTVAKFIASNCEEGQWLALGIPVGGIVIFTGIISFAGIVSSTTNPVYWKAATDPAFAIAANVLGLL